MQYPERKLIITLTSTTKYIEFQRAMPNTALKTNSGEFWKVIARQETQETMTGTDKKYAFISV